VEANCEDAESLISELILRGKRLERPASDKDLFGSDLPNFFPSRFKGSVEAATDFTLECSEMDLLGCRLRKLLPSSVGGSKHLLERVLRNFLLSCLEGSADGDASVARLCSDTDLPLDILASCSEVSADGDIAFRLFSDMDLLLDFLPSSLVGSGKDDNDAVLCPRSDMDLRPVLSPSSSSMEDVLVLFPRSDMDLRPVLSPSSSTMEDVPVLCPRSDTDLRGRDLCDILPSASEYETRFFFFLISLILEVSKEA